MIEFVYCRYCGIFVKKTGRKKPARAVKRGFCSKACKKKFETNEDKQIQKSLDSFIKPLISTSRVIKTGILIMKEAETERIRRKMEIANRT